VDAEPAPPASRRCVSRRRFTIHIRAPHMKVLSADVRVNGRRVRVVRGRKTLRAVVDLRGLPRGRYTVSIRLTLADGRKLTSQRRYRTCAGTPR
jgi:hypothetical protein